MVEYIEAKIRKLDWNNSSEIQERAIDDLTQIDEKDVILLIQPMEKKYWENAALTLKRIGYPRNILAIPGMLNWLMDLNWPGARIALNVLGTIERKTLLPYLESAVEKAIYERDDMWIEALKELAFKSLSIRLDEFENKELFIEFEKYVYTL